MVSHPCFGSKALDNGTHKSAGKRCERCQGRGRTWCGSRFIAVWTSSSSADTEVWRQGFKCRSVRMRSSIDIDTESPSASANASTSTTRRDAPEIDGQGPWMSKCQCQRLQKRCSNGTACPYGMGHRLAARNWWGRGRQSSTRMDGCFASLGRQQEVRWERWAPRGFLAGRAWNLDLTASSALEHLKRGVSTER